MSHPVLSKDKRHQGEKQLAKITLCSLINLSRKKKLLHERRIGKKDDKIKTLTLT